MLSAVISMELHLDELPKAREDLLTAGAMHARDVHALCGDVAAMVFPSAITPPTEATISAVTGKLVAVVSDIEVKLHGNDRSGSGGFPSTWRLLAQSVFLREADLIDFMLARVAEDRLEAKIPASAVQLPVQLLDNADPTLADAAQALLAADSLHRRVRGFTYQALRAELLHQLCWRVVAAIEVELGERDHQVVANARRLLADYDEGQTAQAAAHKLTHFMGDSWDAQLRDPNIAGLQLYVAHFANKLAIDQDQVLQLIELAASAPLAIMLRAVGYDAEQAMAVIYQFKGFGLTPRDIALFEYGFDRLDQNTAHAEVGRWAYERSKYLSFATVSNSGG
jgi:hypothetical protein